MFVETTGIAPARKARPSQGFLNYRKPLTCGAHAYNGPLWLKDGTELHLVATGHAGTPEVPGHYDVELCSLDWTTKTRFTLGSLANEKQHIKVDWQGKALNLLFYASRSGQIHVTVLDDNGRQPGHVC